MNAHLRIAASLCLLALLVACGGSSERATPAGSGTPAAEQREAELPAAETAPVAGIDTLLCSDYLEMSPEEQLPLAAEIGEEADADGMLAQLCYVADPGSLALDVWQAAFDPEAEGGHEAAPETEALTGIDSAWGGVTFPGQIGEYRLVGIDEFAGLASAMSERSDICFYINDQLEYHDNWVEELYGDGAVVQALYTKHASSLANATDCDFMAQTIGISSAASMGTMWDDVPPDANGNACAMYATAMCAVTIGSVAYGATGYSELEEQLPDVSDLLLTVTSANY